MADLDTFTSQWSLSQFNTTDLKPKKGHRSPLLTGPPDRIPTSISASSPPTDNYIRARFGIDRLSTKGSQAAVGDKSWTVTDDSNLGLFGGVLRRHGNLGLLVRALQQDSFSLPQRRDGLQHLYLGRYRLGRRHGTAYALVNILTIEGLGDTQPYAALCLSAQRTLRELYLTRNVGWSATNLSPDLSINPGAQIAVMSYTRSAWRYGQVLITCKAGGVMTAYADGAPSNQWAYTNSVGGMEDVFPLLPISATQTGRVLVLEQGADGPEMVQFVRTSETGVLTFMRVGMVNATVDA